MTLGMGGTSPGHVTFSPTAEQSSPSHRLSISSCIHTWPKTSLTPWSKQGWSVTSEWIKGARGEIWLKWGFQGRVTCPPSFPLAPCFSLFFLFFFHTPFLFSYFSPSNFRENEVNLEILLVADFVCGCQKRWVQYESQRGWAESKVRGQPVVQASLCLQVPAPKTSTEASWDRGRSTYLDSICWIWLSVALQETYS